MKDDREEESDPLLLPPAADATLGNEEQTQSEQHLHPQHASANVSCTNVRYDDETLTLLFEPAYDFTVCNTEILPGANLDTLSNLQFITMARVVTWTIPREQNVSSLELTSILSDILREMYFYIGWKLRDLSPCLLCLVNVNLRNLDDDNLQLLLTCMALYESTNKKKLKPPADSSSISPQTLSSSPQEKNDKKDKREKRERITTKSDNQTEDERTATTSFKSFSNVVARSLLSSHHSSDQLQEE